MSGCQKCPSDEVFVEDGARWSPELPSGSLCRPCAIEEAA